MTLSRNFDESIRTIRTGRSMCPCVRQIRSHRPVPDDISATTALNFGWLAEGPICKAFAQAEPIQHPVDRVARYAQQLARTMAIALGRLQRANQCELRGLADHGIE